MRQMHDVECNGSHKQYENGNEANCHGGIGVQQAEDVGGDCDATEYGKVDRASGNNEVVQAS